MSRAPQYEQHPQIAARKSVIDFVGVPQYSQHYQPEDGIQAMYPPQGPCQAGPTYAQQAYTSPGYPQQAYTQQAYTQQSYTSPGYPQPAYAQQGYTQTAYAPQAYYPQQAYTQQAYPYQAYPSSQYVSSSYAPDPAPASLTEDSLREKINTKIDSIMDSHRAEVLSSQIERLGDKVQRLSRHLEVVNTRPTPAPASLSEPECDEELTKRLKRLASESSKRVKERF